MPQLPSDFGPSYSPQWQKQGKGGPSQFAPYMPSQLLACDFSVSPEFGVSIPVHGCWNWRQRSHKVWVVTRLETIISKEGPLSWGGGHRIVISELCCKEERYLIILMIIYEAA